MNQNEIFNNAKAYASSIKSSKDYQKLVSLKQQINQELGGLVNNFKVAKEKYFEAKKYGEYFPGFKKLQNNLVEAKKALYNTDLVKNYKALETKLQDSIDSVINQIKSNISNKFK